MIRKHRKLIVIGILLLVVIGIWNLSSSLVRLGKSSREIYLEEVNKLNSNSTSEDVYSERDEIVLPGGEVVKNQVGTKEEKTVQCVYDFFSRYLPDLDMENKEYELRVLEDGSYCVHIGDWYLFAKNESNISYIYKYTKEVDFSKYEKEALLGIDITSSFVKEGDLYVWQVE